jgi:adenylate kinase
VEKKKLLEDELVVDTVHKLITKNKMKNVLLDGFPRTLSQAIILEKLVGECSVVISLSTTPELLTKKMVQKLSEEGKAPCEPENVANKISDYNKKAQTILDYYKQLGKLRYVDCAKPAAEVYVNLQKAILPSMYFVIGARAAGKSIVCDYLSTITQMDVMKFDEWEAKKTKSKVSEAILLELVKELHTKPNMKMVIERFPRNLVELRYILLNRVRPNKIIYMNATEGRCMMNSGIEYTSESFKAFQKQSKELITFCKKENLLYEICNTEDTQVEEIKSRALEVLKPEVIIVRYQESFEERVIGMIRELDSKGYLVVSEEQLEADEILRETKIGREFKEYIKNKERIPNMRKVELLKKVVYAISENKQIFLIRFPNTIKELKEFEDNCCEISREFFFGQPESIIADDINLETLMQSKDKLTLMDSFNINLMNTYRGVQLQYALIVGPVTSGKTTTAKQLIKFGFTFIEMEALAEDIKKRLATEDNPIENITVNFPQKLEELKTRTLGRKCKDEKFVLDGLDFEDPISIKKIITALGPPAFYLELAYDPKEVKNRYMKKNEVGELNEEDNARIDKQIEDFDKTRGMIDNLLAELDGMTNHYELSADTTEKELENSIREVFEPKLVLLKWDGDASMSDVFVNLALKYSFLYISIPELIKREVSKRTSIGIELSLTKKPKELIIEDEYSAAHYENGLILRLLKENMKKIAGKYQTAFVYGYLSSYKLKGWEEMQQFRVMDELFALEKEVGEIKSIINITQGDFESVENDRVAEKLEVKVKSQPKPISEEEEKKEEEEVQDIRGNIYFEV